MTASTSMTEGECARLSTSIGSNCVTKLPRAPSPDSDGSVSLRLGHLRGKTILNRFLTRSGHFVTSRREPLRAIRECYTVAIFARVLKSKLSDTSSLDYPPLRVCATLLSLCSNGGSKPPPYRFCSATPTATPRTFQFLILNLLFCAQKSRFSTVPIFGVPEIGFFCAFFT